VITAINQGAARFLAHGAKEGSPVGYDPPLGRAAIDAFALLSGAKRTLARQPQAERCLALPTTQLTLYVVWTDIELVRELPAGRAEVLPFVRQRPCRRQA
jgi:hypothetical protein